MPTTDFSPAPSTGRYYGKAATPFSEGIEPMTNDEQQIAQAIARALETLS
jgi:hypothetical protein